MFVVFTTGIICGALLLSEINPTPKHRAELAAGRAPGAESDEGTARCVVLQRAVSLVAILPLNPFDSPFELSLMQPAVENHKNQGKSSLGGTSRGFCSSPPLRAGPYQGAWGFMMFNTDCPQTRRSLSVTAGPVPQFCRSVNRVLWIGRDLLSPACPAHLLKQGQLEQVTQGCVPPLGCGGETLRRGLKHDALCSVL